MTATTVVTPEFIERLSRVEGSYDLSSTSVYDAAKMLGLNTFDGALPQQWVDHVYEMTGFEAPRLGMVWCYDVAKVFGEPVPLTTAALVLLRWYQTGGSAR